MKKLEWCVVISSLLFSYSIAEDINIERSEKELIFLENGKSSQENINRFNMVAKKIAGISFGQKPNQKALEYSEFINNSWNRLCQDSLGHVSKWSEKHLKQYIEKYDTLFYPFGGPDISYAISFFPHAKRYILVGLEPLGDFNQLETNLNADETFDSIRAAFSHYLRKGYFITSEMLTQLSDKNIKGGLSLILLALSKLGFDILKIKNCCIDDNGNIVESDSKGVKCLKVVCQKSNQKKEIYYVRTDLINDSAGLPCLQKFVNKFEFSTLIKSASYALHDQNFSKIRSFILDNTNCILQDDTGIPFNFFRQNWDIHIFGTYTKPTLPVFRSFKQNSLSEYYSKYKAEPIPFPIGYGYIKRTPNLIFTVSVKKVVERWVKGLKFKRKACNCYDKKAEER